MTVHLSLLDWSGAISLTGRCPTVFLGEVPVK